MSDLLKKKKTNLLAKSEVVKPTQPYQEHSLLNRGNKQATTNDPTPGESKAAKKKSTTVRCDVDTAQHLSAIITCQNFNSINEALIALIDLYEKNLTEDERREISQLKTILARNK